MEFPDSVEGFGYSFNEVGQLRSISSGEPYQFHFKEDDHSYNQKRYEALGEVITSFVYDRLVDDCGLKRLSVPLEPSEGQPKTFIFCSENYNTADKLLILIHGSGVVRAGQWARRLIINDCLDSGTQIPFIKRGLQEGYGILVMNTNDHTQMIDGTKMVINESDSPEIHAKYVWKNYVRKCTASHVAIVAHSYGGVVLTHLADKFALEFRERVFAVALTDSVHYRISKNSNLIKVGRNWIGSSKPLDTLIERSFGDIECVSAGCMEHEMTSWSSFNSIFQFFSERLSVAIECAKSEPEGESSPQSVFTVEDEEEDVNAGGNISCADSFDRKVHSISPDLVDESTRHSKEDDLDELVDPMEIEIQPLDFTSEIFGEPFLAKEDLEQLVNTGLRSSTTAVTTEANGVDDDSEINDLSNLHVVEKTSEPLSPEVKVASEPVASPKEEL